MQVLITRSEPGASRMAAELTAAGFTCLVAPLLKAVPTNTANPADSADRAKQKCISRVIFVSEHAVQHAPDLFQQLGEAVRWYAIGPATGKALANKLADTHIAVTQPSLANSEGLLAEPSLQNIAGETCLLVAGEGGRQLLRDTLVERGAVALVWSVYRRQATIDAGVVSAAIAANLKEIDACVASSGDGLELLSRQWFMAGGGAEVPVCVPSPRVAELARNQGWQNVVCCAGASAAATIEGLRSA